MTYADPADAVDATPAFLKTYWESGLPDGAEIEWPETAAPGLSFGDDALITGDLNAESSTEVQPPDGVVGGSYDFEQRSAVAGTAPAEQVTIITAQLVRNQDVDIDFWIQPVTGLVTRAEFSTDGLDGEGTIDWTLVLSDYGADFDISPPEGLVDDG